MSSDYICTPVFAPPVTMLEYRDIANPGWLDTKVTREGAYDDPSPNARETAQLSEAELAERIWKEREQASRETEQKARREYEDKLALVTSSVTCALKSFSEEKSEYFTRVEAEVVQLALAIAGKILHREAQVDPLLVAALVKIAIDRMREGSQVTVRVNPTRASDWRSYLAGTSTPPHVEVVSDSEVSESDCIVETELGSANFGLDTQLKEIEQGFFDLLALRPAKP